MLGHRHEAVFDNGDEDGEHTERDGGVAGRWRDRQGGSGDGDGDGAPGADVRGGEAAVGLGGEVVDAGVGLGEEDVHADAHEDGHEGADTLGVELDDGRSAQEMGCFEVAEHICRLLRRSESEHTSG